MNILKPQIRIAVHTLLAAGRSQREIERLTGVDRKTIRRLANSPTLAAGSVGGESEALGNQIPPPRSPGSPPKLARSAREEHRGTRKPSGCLRDSDHAGQDGVIRVLTPFSLTA